MKEKGFHKYIERAQKNQIKIPVSDVIKFPTEVARYLQKLKKSSTSFGGKTGRKVINYILLMIVSSSLRHGFVTEMV